MRSKNIITFLTINDLISGFQKKILNSKLNLRILGQGFPVKPITFTF